MLWYVANCVICTVNVCFVTMLIYVYVGSDRPALKYLNRHVVIPIAPKWHDVGLELMEVEDEKELDQIKAEGSDNKENTKRVLKLWLDKNPHASWNDLILVLRIPTIGLRTTALEIEGMLLSESMCAVSK